MRWNHITEAWSWFSSSFSTVSNSTFPTKLGSTLKWRIFYIGNLTFNTSHNKQTKIYVFHLNLSLFFSISFRRFWKNLCRNRVNRNESFVPLFFSCCCLAMLSIDFWPKIKMVLVIFEVNNSLGKNLTRL